jgi:hypothetical protein
MAVKKSMMKTGCASIVVLSSLFTICNAQNPKLSVEAGKVWVKGIEPEVLYTFQRYFNSPKDWESVFPITLRENVDGIVVNGQYEIFTDAIAFSPRFPFVPGERYEAKFFADQLAHNTNEVYLPVMNPAQLRIEFTAGSDIHVIPSAVTAVYPTSDSIPENILKFHVQFSQPMVVGEAYTRIKLVDAAGKEVEKPFLIVDEELWDADMKVLTLLFDPGRIKRGLRPNIEMKTALQAGKRYALVIEKGWRDINGKLTDATYIKNFICINADRISPDVSSYGIMVPEGPKGSLIVLLREPLDYILLSNSLRITDSQGNVLDGSLQPRNHETVVEFVPKHPWLETQYTIHFNPLTEDLAGNNLNRLFDEDLTSKQTVHRNPNTVTFTFANSSR